MNSKNVFTFEIGTKDIEVSKSDIDQLRAESGNAFRHKSDEALARMIAFRREKCPGIHSPLKGELTLNEREYRLLFDALNSIKKKGDQSL